MALRKQLTQEPLPVLGAHLSTVLAVATLNRESHVLAEKFRKAQKAADKSGTMTVDQLADLPISSEDGLFKVDAGAHADAATDTIDSWLFEAASCTDTSSDTSSLSRAAFAYSKQFSLQRSHYELWQRALWEGWRLESQKEHLLFVPADRELAELTDAWLLRKQSNFMEYGWLDRAVWPKLPMHRRRELQLQLTVTGVEKRPGRRRQFIVTRPAVSRGIPLYRLVLSGLEGSYLASFLDRELPKLTGVCCSILLRAWYVLHDLTEVLGRSRRRPNLDNVENARQWALVVRRSELIEALGQALRIKREDIERIITFFSWQKGTYKGLWGAPLVPLPGRLDQYAIAEGVLATSNPIRRVEIWLTKGGLDDNLARSPRGKSFEAQLRSEIRAQLSRNTIVRNTACAEHAIKKSADSPEEIDLLIQFGSLLLVGDVKCWLVPTDSRERYNFLRNLKSACTQVSRKAAAIAERRDLAASALGTTVAVVQRLKVLPLVVLNQGYGMSLVFDDCVVTDAKFLKLYLSDGSYLSEAAVNHVDGGSAHGTRHLYRNEHEAARNFEATMRKPPPLYRFRDCLKWTSFGFPTASGKILQIAQTELGDLPIEARELHDRLKSALKC